MSEVSYNSPLPGFSFKYSSCPRASNPLPILHLLSFIHHDSNTDVLRVVYMFNRNVILFREYSGNCGAASQSVVNNAVQYHARRAALVQCISSTTACYVRRASGVNSGYTPIGNTLIAIRTPRRCNTLDGPRGGKRGGGGGGSGVPWRGNEGKRARKRLESLEYTIRIAQAGLPPGRWLSRRVEIVSVI